MTNRDEALIRAALEMAAAEAEECSICTVCGDCFVASAAIRAIDPSEVLAGIAAAQPLTPDELAQFRKDHPRDGLALAALAAWCNVRPDQLPPEMQAHTCPATMEAWQRVTSAIEAEVLAKVGDGWQPRPVAIPAEGVSIEAMRAALLDTPAGCELVSAGDTGLYWMNHGDAFALLPTPPQEAPNE